MSDNSLPPVTTKAQFQALYSRPGFSRAEKGTFDNLNTKLLSATSRATRTAMLVAEHERHSTLSRDDARRGIELTPEYPKGVY